MSKKVMALILTILCSCLITEIPTLALSGDQDVIINSQQISTFRLSGQTRYETGKVISEYYSSGKVQNVILCTGNAFADALSAVVLAHNKEAPILLTNTTVAESNDAFEYIIEHLDTSGTVYLIGGPGIIGAEFELKLNDCGFNNIVRIAGIDRYDTSLQIACSLNNGNESTLVIASGEQFPDALSISGFAANKGWPILLSPHDALPQSVKDYMLAKDPIQVYITGGAAAISDSIESDIKSILPFANIKRLTGQSRFDTNVLIAETFVHNPSTIYLTSGYSFSDALSGSALAAKNGNPIIFADPSVPTLPQPTAAYFERLYANNLAPGLISLGGSAAVSEEIIQSSKDLILGIANETSIYSIPDINITVPQNEEYSLPATVPARLYNSDITELPVQWNQKDIETSNIGISTYIGNVEGYSQAVRLNLTVTEPLPIAEYTTHFNSALVNRSENIRLAARSLDEIIIAPGEQFSFNRAVGQRTVQAGYKEAMFIEGNTYTPGLGGGVCQVSSTLYNAVALAHLEILERHHHTLTVDYVPIGQDATVSYPDLDFRFKNNTSSYIKIRSSVEGNTLSFKIYK